VTSLGPWGARSFYISFRQNYPAARFFAPANNRRRYNVLLGKDLDFPPFGI